MKPRYIAHTGNERPVIGSAWVEVVFRSGNMDYASARSWYWNHDGDSSDIIAYRVIEQE
jgi:hypothetical protein